MPSLRDAEESQRTFATPQRARKRLRYRTFKYVTDDFGNQILFKICSGCNRWLRESDYANIDKHTRRPKGLCYECKRAYDVEWSRARREQRREYGRNLRRRHMADPVLREILLAHERRKRQKADPELKRKSSREHYYRIKSDPEKYAAYLETRRIQARLRREREGKENIPTRGSKLLKFPKKVSREKLPVGPISEWVTQRAKVYGGNKDFAKYCKIDERMITRIINKEHTEVTFSVVDEILTNEGSTFIWDLYPEEYERLLEVA